MRDRLDQQVFTPGALPADGLDTNGEHPSLIFGRARATGSLLAALGEDSMGAAAEAVYEAHALGKMEAETLIALGRRILAQ